MIGFLKRLDQPLSPILAFLIGLLLSILSFGQEIFSSSFSIDDFYHSLYPPGNAAFGRITHEILYDYILMSNFVPFFSFIIGFSLLNIGIIVFCKTAGFRLNAVFFILLIFFVLHVGFIDAFNNNSHVITHSLSVLCSILAISLVSHGRKIVFPAFLFFVSLSLFQPFAAAGLILAATQASMQIVREEQLDVKWAVRLGSAVIAGSLVYIIAHLIYFRFGGSIDSRVDWALSVESILENIETISGYVYDNFFSTYIYRSPISGVISFLIYLSFGIFILLRAARQSTMRLALTVFVVVLFPLLPFAAKFPITAELPVRGQACFGLAIGACASILYENASWGAISARLPLWLSSRLLLLALTGATFLASWYVITLAYDHQHRTELRDRLVASQMLGDIYRFARENDVPVDRFQVAGRRGVEPEKWYYPITANAFSEWWGATAIFRHVGFAGADISYVDAPDVACAAWPAAGSIVVYRGEALLCLSAFPRNAGRE